METIDLQNENIGFQKNVVHGPIGTSAWFFPFLMDYFTVLNSTAVKLATKTQRHKVIKKVLLKKILGAFVPWYEGARQDFSLLYLKKEFCQQE